MTTRRTSFPARGDKRDKVFCIGLSKTGTSTFAEAMLRLGYRHRTGPVEFGALLCQRNHTSELLKLTGNHDSFDDFPWPMAYQTLADHYPDARFVLTVRKDTATWLRSWTRNCDRVGQSLARRIYYGETHPREEPELHARLYETHNQAAVAFFANTGRLLTVCWEKGDGWSELGEFLATPVPEGELPHRHAAASKDPKAVVRKLLSLRKADHAEYFARVNEREHPGLYTYLLGLMADEAKQLALRKDRQTRGRRLRRLIGLTRRY